MSTNNLIHAPITKIKVRYKNKRKAQGNQSSKRAYSAVKYHAIDISKAYYDQLNPCSKEDFILDCCKVTINKLPEYNSYRDRNMTNYFKKQPHYVSIKDIM